MDYRTEYAYRPINDPAPVDPIARTHFEELSRYLAFILATGGLTRSVPTPFPEPAGCRIPARQALIRLTRQQFQELSTDVYDELARRKNDSDTRKAPVPFLPVRDDFHLDRNRARQNLATVSTARFKDLSVDVYYELARRYPELKEEASYSSMAFPASMYGEMYDEDSPEVLISCVLPFANFFC
ncbi:hypothetical protein EW146_g5385 [Bondarzewia mesenterica]|uniref:GIT Spa2 homology (SHD) domain-containing protein n=1 Tax=Bondarzewia mesenterica TaxID=1095465 RepID=A0A4S4LS83_9AGAM|nr:hypothetical protein EW146_g5385 [Bondarzewia mesenterica]